ncbi:MAG: hypothetical protein J6Q38_02720 [Clostridia bacterium]|nr:hypothetical protein [Clostridia bacterium]
MSKKPRVVFAFTEAGLGHIMPLKSIADAFTKKYGNKVEVIRSNFFTESNKPALIKYEKFLINEVKKQNRHNWYGYASTFLMEIFGSKIDNHALMKWFAKNTYKEAVKHVDELEADTFVSTHWATNYYAVHSKSKPLTLTYVPDAFINPLFRYNCNLTLCSMKTGYDEAKKHKKRYNESNLKLVPFAIRNEAFEFSRNKKENREILGLPLDKFTITLAEGGYGLGKMEEIIRLIIERDLPITCIPICGKNKALYDKFSNMVCGKNTVLYPLPFTPNLFGYIASSDLFLGKSGNMIAEPTFFGVPSIITKHTTNIEKHIADYYVNYLKCAINLFNPEKIVDKLESFIKNPELLAPFIKNAETARDLYGAEKSADLIFELLKTKYPNL